MNHHLFQIIQSPSSATDVQYCQIQVIRKMKLNGCVLNLKKQNTLLWIVHVSLSAIRVHLEDLLTNCYDHFFLDSTMCKKRQYLLQLLDGTVQTTVSRGCANQKNDEMVR